MDFTKIPKEILPSVRQMVFNGDIEALIDIHNKYELSDYKYSCCDQRNILWWFQSAMVEKLI